MKVIKFRIKKYKSIKDSGDCYLDDKITILAGKNEAGKTAIVEALEDFNVGRSIKQKAIPLWNKSAEPIVNISIKLEDEEIEELVKYLQENLNEVKNTKTLKNKLKKISIELIKIFPNKNKISHESLSEIYSEIKSLSNIVEKLRELIKYCNDKLQNFPISESFISTPQKILNILANYSPQYKPNISNSEKQTVFENIGEIRKLSTESGPLIKFSYNLEQFILQNFVPNFILFTTFDDILPSQKPITEAPNVAIIKDLAIISNLDFSKIQPSKDPKEREKHREQVNLNFSKEYEQFWTQDHANLFINWDSNNIYFWIREGEEYYDPDMRSKGKQWHLAYYIRVTARSLEGGRSVILIDEPGLFLHAKAQRDILKKLEECSKSTQIIYTTHSPYLIPSGRLNRVRLVRKYETKGTKIEKLTAEADKETLTPIFTAIGEDLSGGIKIDKKNSIVLEGLSDYLYLITFKKLFNYQQELNFIPCVGAGSVPHVGGILFGWSIEPIFILDNDRNGSLAKNKLLKKLSIKEDRIIQVPFDKRGSIEDMFSESDYKKYIKTDNLNSYGKVLLAKEFYKKVDINEITLSDLSKETIENFKNVFRKLVELFE
jgi:hypothetical protein